MNVAFCTCRDTKCPLNPVNHDRGCTPCIGKCLREGELPSCFFNAVAPYRGPDADYTYQGFAQLVLEAERPCTAGRGRRARSQMQSPPAGNLRTSTGYFFRPCGRFSRGLRPGESLGWKKQRPDTSRPLFFLCGKSYFCITAPSFAPDTSFA